MDGVPRRSPNTVCHIVCPHKREVSALRRACRQPCAFPGSHGGVGTGCRALGALHWGHCTEQGACTEQPWHTGGVRTVRSNTRACMDSCKCAQLCKFSWVTHTVARLSARRFAAAGVAGAPVQHGGFVPWLPLLVCLLASLFRQELCQTGCKAESSIAELCHPLPTTQLLPCHLRNSNPSVHSRAHHSRQDTPKAAAVTAGPSLTVTHSWKKPSLGQGRRKSAASGADPPCGEGGKRSWEGRGRHRHTCTRTHTEANVVAARGNY